MRLADKQVFQHDGALEEVDEEVHRIIKQEKGRQVKGIPESPPVLLAYTPIYTLDTHSNDCHFLDCLLQVHGLELIASENFTSRAVSKHFKQHALVAQLHMYLTMHTFELPIGHIRSYTVHLMTWPAGV